jgi:hypothetical protein
VADFDDGVLLRPVDDCPDGRGIRAAMDMKMSKFAGWTMRGDAADLETLNEIERQEDRGAAVIGGAFLEDYLVDALKQRLLKDQAVINDFFGGMGPLATFNAKIEMAYLLGLIGKQSRQKMHSIRRIRNEFAHNLRPLSFEAPRIKNMCQALISQDKVADFLTEELKRGVSGESIPDLVSAMVSRFDVSSSARHSYLGTIKVLTFCLRIVVS